MAFEDASASDSLYVRPVLEEFKAFVQHKIGVLERFKNVDELEVYLDALELGLNTIQDIQIEAKEDIQITEVEFQGGEDGMGTSEEPGVETEELEGVDDGGEEEFALANAGEVLVGEKEEGSDRETGLAMETEETLQPADVEQEKPLLDIGAGEDEEHDTGDPGEGEVDGVLATRFVKISEEAEPPDADSDEEDEDSGDGGIEVELPDSEPS
jgi:hypothetical protein